MSHIRNMYCMVKAVKKESRRMDRLEPQQIKENGHEVWWSPQDNVKRIFLKHRKRWGWTVGEAEEVFADCCSEGYGYLVQDKLKPNSAVLISGNSSIDVVVLSTKGRKLIEKSFFIFPTGLWYAWYEEDGKKFFAITGAIITLLLAIVGLLTKITFFDKHH